MRKIVLSIFSALCVVVLLPSCKKDDNSGPQVKAYTVPTSYNFSNVNYSSSTQLVKMVVEVDAYLKTANVGTTVVSLDQSKVNSLLTNTGNPFTDATLNSSGVSLTNKTSNAVVYKSLVDSLLSYNTGVTATPGVGGFVARGANKIIVGSKGLEYGQAFLKGTMGALQFKEVVNLLTSIKTLPAMDTAMAQSKWDEAFGHLGVPSNYDSSIVYVSTDVNRPLLWGGYLAERGQPIQAGGTIFQAFLKGRAAIGGYDVAVRNSQADIILAKWEQLCAAAALNYLEAPTASSAIGNYGTQLHALSEAYGFISAFNYRPVTSKLSNADFEMLNTIIHGDFYELLNQPGFTDLVRAQIILKSTFNL